MNYSASLTEQESEFLDAIAREFGFGSDSLTVFLTRFDKNKRSSDNSSLVKNVSWNREPVNITQKFQDELKTICQVLEDNGCQIQKSKRGRQPKGNSPWEQAFKWLWETKFIEWQQSQKELVQPINIDELVQTARDKIDPYIEERCSTMRVLDMTQPIGLDDIYTSVNILEKITGRIRVSSIECLEEFTQNKNVSADNFNRFILGGVREKRVPGQEAVEKYSKLMILGKPGAGKTTFLKHLAYSCIKGKFQEQSIPIFITLKDFAEAQNQPNLLQYLIQLFEKYDITTNTDASINPIEQLLKQGKLLVLLDGLDEVRDVDSTRILKFIQEFITDYPANQFVITCRIAAKEYTFQQFTEVEVADFNDEQIECFSRKWFTAKEDKVKATKFVEKLQDDKPIRELATNPLLLTLLCLVFEESGEFPKNRSELYKEGLDVLLKKWDVKRNIERHQIYKKLSIKRKEDLLSKVAYSTFEQGQLFFKQKEIESRIIDYIRNLPDCSDDPEVLQLDSEAVLKSIEAQHGLLVERARGVYSFSHLTFQEYFTAREIKETGDNKLLLDLCAHITKTRWREVFLLTVEMLKDAEWLLQSMKKNIDGLLKDDTKLQHYLTWGKEKSENVEAAYKKPAAIRAFYLSLDRILDLSKSLDLDRDQIFFLSFNLDLSLDLSKSLSLFLCLSLSVNLDQSLSLELFSLDLSLDLSRSLSLDLDLSLCVNLSRSLCLSRNHSLSLFLSHSLCFSVFRNLDPNSELKRLLQELKDQLPDHEADEEAYSHWWQENGQAWDQKLRTVMIEHRNIGHDWQFTDSQKELLKKYHDANKLLVECLNSDCYTSRDTRQHIEDTLLLPINSIPPTHLKT